MSVGLYRGAAAMTASEKRLEAITSNLANSSSTAFKRATAVHHAVPATGRGGENDMIETMVSRDWSQGHLERTGVATDLALVGDGFFAVEGPAAEIYTRNGSFSLTETGVLVTQEGYPVAWDGARGTFDPAGDPITVDSSGKMFQGRRSIGRLRLVDFDARELLRVDRDGYYLAPPALLEKPASADVHQGALEGSNVSPVEELVSLIQNQRAFEASANVTSMISETYRRLNNFR